MGKMFESQKPAEKEKAILKSPGKNLSPMEQRLFEAEPNLADTSLCFRVFKIGAFDEKSLEQFKKQVATIENFNQNVNHRLAEKAPQITIITNSDLDEAGKQELNFSGLQILYADQSKAKRRSSLAQHIIGEKSSAKGDFSYADMLNEPAKKQAFSDFIFASSDLANKPEDLLIQILGMKITKDFFEAAHPGKLAIIGSAVKGVHHMELINKIIEGDDNVNLENLSQVLHNNTLSLVGKEAKFSGITDNFLAGKVEINGKQEPIGGNEDFLYGLKEILYHGKDCVLLIEPHISGERQGEVSGVDAKYLRRVAVYKLYAERSIRQAGKRKKIDLGYENGITEEKLNTTIEDLMDKHLFFARINDGGKPEIVLTNRQRTKRILSPF
jgi:hypothetical protein